MNSRPFIQTTLLSLMGRLGGLVIPFLIAALYGATQQTDAFFLAYGLAIAFTTLFAQMFESAIIPYLAPSKGMVERSHWFLNTAFRSSLPVFVAAGLGLAAVLPLFLQSAGWEKQAALQVREMLFVLQPFLWFGLAAASANGLFFHRHVFAYPAVSPLVRAIVVITFIFGGHKILGIHAITVGLALGEALRYGGAALLLHAERGVRKNRYQPEAADKTLLNKFFKDAFWQMAALLAVHLMVVADQCFAQTAGTGQLTLLSYADRLIQIPYLLFLSGFLNILHADWSKASAEGTGALSRRLRHDLIWVAAGAVLVAFSLAVTSGFFTGIFYGKAPLQEHERGILKGLFMWYALALAPGVIRLSLGRVLIVLRASKFYCVQAWIELMLNIAFNMLFMRLYGVIGIAMATALVYTLSSFWLYAYLTLRKENGVSL